MRVCNQTDDFQIAVIIPFRDREYHLYKLLSILFHVLKRQQLDFRIILAEQVRLWFLVSQK